MPQSKRRLKEVFFQSGKVWKYRTDFVLEHLLRTQSVAAKRNLTPLHFWRFRPDLSGFDETYRESSINERKYDTPTPVWIFPAHSGPGKPLKDVGVVNEITHTFKIDMAEAIRLGELFEVADDGLNFHFYLPRPGDVYQWNQSLFEVSEVKPVQYYQPLDRFVVWEGHADLLRLDSTDPNVPIAVLPQGPELEHPLWLR